MPCSNRKGHSMKRVVQRFSEIFCSVSKRVLPNCLLIVILLCHGFRSENKILFLLSAGWLFPWLNRRPQQDLSTF